MNIINSEKLELIVEEDLLKITPPRLDRWLAKKIDSNNELPTLSRTRLKQLILEGYVMQNGQTIRDPSAIVKHLQKYSVVIPEAVQPTPIAEKIDLTIIYEDNSLLVIDKPANMVVHPAPGASTGTLVNALLAHCGNSLSGIGGVKRPGIVHRLDKDTSGIMVVAKTIESHASLINQLQQRSVKREYEAVVVGVMTGGGIINAPLGRHPVNRKKQAVNEGGKEAITHYKVIDRYRLHPHVQLNLETGRTHQIRVHMAHIKHRLVGDQLYGGRLQMPAASSSELRNTLQNFKRQALHAKKILLTHPEKGEKMEWEVERAEDMQELLDSLKSDHEVVV